MLGHDLGAGQPLLSGPSHPSDFPLRQARHVLERGMEAINPKVIVEESEYR